MDDASVSAYRAEIETWRADMERQLRAPGPGGWLAIVGMYPLNVGINTIGSAPDSDVLLPAGRAPERLGVVDFDRQHGTLTVLCDERVTVDEAETRTARLRNHYEPGGMSVVRVRDVRFGIMQWASDPYNIRVWDADSPKRLNFGGRVWYPIDPAYRLRAHFTPYGGAREMVVDHTGGETQILKNIGAVDFMLHGQAFQFEAAASELGAEYVWLLMRDGTTGKATYGAGRFLHAPRIDEQTIDLDFNRLYHPPCAFCDYTTCPMPPRGNLIPFPLHVGEHFPGVE
jgi:uncharacterized protein (DUF1684 family)